MNEYPTRGQITLTVLFRPLCIFEPRLLLRHMQDVSHNGQRWRTWREGCRWAGLAIGIKYAEKRKTADSDCYGFVIRDERGHHSFRMKPWMERGEGCLKDNRFIEGGE